MPRNEHPEGSHPEFIAPGKRTIRGNALEEVGSCRLKVGRRWAREMDQPSVICAWINEILKNNELFPRLFILHLY